MLASFPFRCLFFSNFFYNRHKEPQQPTPPSREKYPPPSNILHILQPMPVISLKRSSEVCNHYTALASRTPTHHTPTTPSACKAHKPRWPLGHLPLVVGSGTVISGICLIFPAPQTTHPARSRQNAELSIVQMSVCARCNVSHRRVLRVLPECSGLCVWSGRATGTPR
jgi:hypothetical protein